NDLVLDLNSRTISKLADRILTLDSVKIYFSYQQLPEMQDIPPAEREKLWQSFLQHHGSFTFESVVVMIVAFPVLIFGAFCIKRIGRYFDMSNTVQTLMIIPFFVAILFMVAGAYITLVHRAFKNFVMQRK